MKKITALMLSSAMMLSLAACGGSASTETVSSEAASSEAASSEAVSTEEAASADAAAVTTVNAGKLTMSTNAAFPPYEMTTDNGDFEGIDIEVADAIAKKLGLELQVDDMDFDAALLAAQNGKSDMVMAGVTVTDERKEKVDFAKPYMKVALGVVSPENAEITDVSQLKGKTLIIAKGTTAESYFEKNEPDVKLQKYDQYADAYNALLDGRGDAFSTDNTEVLAWAKTNKGFKVGITKLGDEDTIAPAVQKGNKELLNWINDEIVKLGKENFFHKDYEETLKPVYGSDVDPNDIVVEGGEL